VWNNKSALILLMHGANMKINSTGVSIGGHLGDPGVDGMIILRWIFRK
jgi:hypothetical protein